MRDVLLGHLSDVSHLAFLFAFSITSASFHISLSDLSSLHIACALKRNLIFGSVCMVIFHPFGW